MYRTARCKGELMDETTTNDQFGQGIAIRYEDGMIEYNRRVTVQSGDTNNDIDNGINDIIEKWFELL